MKEKNFSDLEENYDLEINRIVKIISKEKAKRVLLQFPDGLKPYAVAIKDKIKSELDKIKQKNEIFLWLDSCFGACDIPIEVEKLGIDLIIQFGHSDWNYSEDKGIRVVN